MQAIRVRGVGGPAALELADLPRPVPGVGEVLVRVTVAGVNFIDIYHRTGRYPLPLPFIPGQEGAGSVAGVGPGVSGLRAGDRVAWAGVPGGYAQYVVVPLDRLVSLPDGVTDQQAAAVLLQGMTAHYLVHDTCPIAAGDSVLIHAGAGGTGLLLTQMAKRLGARVITTVSNDVKEAASRAAGADAVIRYTVSDFVAEVRRLTQDTGVRVVYDSVGQSTFDGSLRCLASRGMLVLFGASSDPVQPVDPMVLARHGSLYLTRPSLWHYVADRDALRRRAAAVLGRVADGSLRVHVHRVRPLAEAAAAHRDLEGRITIGKVLLLPPS